MEDKCIILKSKNPQCNWSEVVDGVLVQCSRFTTFTTIKDDFNINDRWFCLEEHIIRVERDIFKLFLKMKAKYEKE